MHRQHYLIMSSISGSDSATEWGKENKILAQIYFTRKDQKHVICSCGSGIKFEKAIDKRGNELTHNTAMIAHIKGKHKNTWQKSLDDYMKDVVEISDGQTKITQHIPMMTDKAKSVHGWMKFILEDNLELSCCDSPNFIKYTQGNLAPITSVTLKKYMGRVALLVEQNLKQLVAKKQHIGLIFDMWDDGAGTKQLGVFLCFPNIDYSVAQIWLLCLTPLQDETNSTGENQVATINVALGRIGISWERILFIVADNTAVNPKIARLAKVYFVGCRSHVLALAVKNEVIEEKQDLVDKVHQLCVKLRTPKQRAQLRKNGTNLTPFIYNGVRWSAAYNMLKRYIKQIVHYVDPKDPDLKGLVTSVEEDADILALLQHMEKFQSVTLRLQDPKCTLHHADLLFTGLYSMTKAAHLSPTHDLNNSVFVRAILKVCRNEESQLTVEEAATLERFQLPDDDSDGDDSDDESDASSDFALDIIKADEKVRRKETEPSKYVPLHWIPPTSNDAERLFSRCRRVFTEFRRAMTPYTLEMLVYLTVNRGLWDKEMVNIAVNNYLLEEAIELNLEGLKENLIVE